MTDHFQVIARQLIAGEPPDPTAAGLTARGMEAMSDCTRRLEATPDDAAWLAEFLERVSVCADARMAVNNFQRFLEVRDDPATVREHLRTHSEAVTILVALFAGSQFLSDVLMTQPDGFEWLLEPEVLHGARPGDYYKLRVADATEGLTDRAAQRTAISRWRRREYLRIGCRDLLMLADAENVSRDISDLAEAIIDRGAMIIFKELSARFGIPVPDAIAWEGPMVATEGGMVPSEDGVYSTGMCVLGMGKLGGRELNFSSDIDLVFIYEAEGSTAGRMDGTRRVAVISNHDFFTRLGEALVRFLGERGPDGNLFRVDMRLRPEGADGPLARSLESFVTYLNTQGRDWERLAYLKARVVSGPSRLKEKLYRLMSEFVFSGQDAARIISEVQELKVRIDREVLNSDLYYREVKRGYGGIREIEFVVAAMQLIYGAHHHALRVRNTFLAIQRLLETHILSRGEAEFYLRAYSFLRMVEHRLQMAQEAQTHTLPLPGPEFEANARRCGFADGAAFQVEFERITHGVHKRFTDFFKHDTEALEQAAKDILIILDRDAPEAEALEAMARRGFEEPEALRLVHSLVYGTSDVFVTADGQRSVEQMLPSLLRMAASAPYPGRVLSHFLSFAMAIKGITYYYEVISQHPDILKMLVTIFGTSDNLASTLIAYPEFFDTLISTRVVNETDKTGEKRRERMRGVLSVKSPQRRLMILRRVAHFERLVLALRYLLQHRPLDECLRDLSDVADVAVDLGMHLAVGRLLARWRDVERVPDEDVVAFIGQIQSSLCVAALGKYGGCELNFYGDLDVVFVYDGSQPLPEEVRDRFSTAEEFYDVVSDTLTTVMSEQATGGRVFELDARLRPYGRNAPLPTEVGLYEQYLQNEAEVWELQAFHRARCAWGSAALLDRLHPVAQRRAGQLGEEVLREEIDAMRKRLEESVTGGDGKLDVKRAPGGLVDVEFVVQYMVLKGALPWVPENANYYHVLSNSQAWRGILTEGERSVLMAGYRMLRTMENTIRLVAGGGVSSLPLQSANARAVGRSLGFEDAERLERVIADARRNVRAVYDRVFVGT